MQPKTLDGKRVSILGAARSGRAVAAMLLAKGAKVFVSDRAPAERLLEAVEEFRAQNIPAEFGVNSPRVLDADLIRRRPNFNQIAFGNFYLVHAAPLISIKYQAQT